jgi:hypothetical protein
MDGDVIKSFLVGLGFGVDDASLAKFNKAITSAAVKVTALYASIKLSAAGIFYSISKISEGFEEMGYNLRLVAPAVNKMLILREAMLDAYRHAGIDLTKVVQQSILFNLSLAKTKFALEAVYKSVGAKFLPLLTKQMDIFRQKIFANMPKIQEQLTKVVQFIFKAFEATVELGQRLWSMLERVYGFFKKLDEATGGWSTKILAVIAAWQILNLGFLATPLGMIIAGFIALLALWDDFQVWREGGQSLINWGSDMSKTIVGLVAAIGLGVAALYAWKGAMVAWNAVSKAFEIVLAVMNGELGVTTVLASLLEAPFWLIAAAIGAVIAAVTLADAKWQIFGGHLSGFFSGVGGKVLDFLGGAHAGNVASAGSPSPLTGGAGGNTQKVNQETTINVQGSADANSVGKAVASQQGAVNFDMTRNLKGAMR